MAIELEDSATGSCEGVELLFGAFAELERGVGSVEVVEEELLEVAATLDFPVAGESFLLVSAGVSVDAEDSSDGGKTPELFGSSKGSVEVELSIV